MLRLRDIALRLLPLLVVVWATVAVLGGAVYLVAKHADPPDGSTAAKAGLGLCAVSVAVFAGKAVRRLLAPPLLAGLRPVLVLPRPQVPPPHREGRLRSAGHGTTDPRTPSGLPHVGLRSTRPAPPKEPVVRTRAKKRDSRMRTEALRRRWLACTGRKNAPNKRWRSKDRRIQRPEGVRGWPGLPIPTSGMMVIFVGIDLATADGIGVRAVVILVFTLVCAGAMVGAINGLALVWLLRSVRSERGVS